MPTYRSGLIPDFWRRYEQRKGITGRSLTSGEIAAIEEPMLDLEYRKSQAAEDRAQRQAELDRQYALQRDQINAANRAATVSGVTDIAGLYGAYKLGSQRNALLGSMLGGGSPVSPATGFLPSLSPPGPLNAFASGTGAAGGGLLTGGAGGGGILSPAATAPAISGPTAFSPSMLAEGALAPSGPGLLATGGYGLLGAGAGYGVSKALGANKDISEGLSLGGAGAGIGFAVGGPPGALIGGLIGVGASLLDDIGDFFGGLF